MWYTVPEPNAYLAITGLGINTVQIKKKAMIYPMQKVSKFSITPFDFSMALQAMTIEKLKFSLPAVFTIGPEDNLESIMKYAVLLTGKDNAQRSGGTIAVGAGRGHVQDIVQGIIEGETRSIVSTMTMEELFKERQVFRDHVIRNVQSELSQFGLKIYNANVKELQDCPGSEYFLYLSKKAHEGALNQAKVDVAEARMKGEVGEADRKGKTKQEIAKIDAATAVLETERKAEKAAADAQLADKEIHIGKELKMSQISAQWAAEGRDAELQTVVQKKRAEMELERRRATEVTQAIIARESEQQKADAKQYTAEKVAAAALYTAEKEAAGTKAGKLAETDAEYYDLTRTAEANKSARQMDADAEFYAKSKEADALYYMQKQEAHGMIEKAKALGAMAGAFGGPQGLLQYMMLENNTYEKLALANAKAVNGLQPKISVWNTSGSEGMADPSAPIKNLFKSLPPLLETINEQTGIRPLSWLLNMPEADVGKPLKNGKLTNGTNVVNGHHDGRNEG